jgi:integrative and conjugative element protein (TIGR02256 family)
VHIWSIDENTEVKLHVRAAAAVKRIPLGDWLVTYDENVESELVALRARNLPHETGGVLLGISDASRHSIHIVRALPQPADSHGTVTRFERGVAGLQATVTAAAEASLHQVRYVGEWHSHPVGSSTRPSTIDLQQLCWLTEELESEGLPALMAIAGDDGSLSFLLGGRRSAPPVAKERA